MKMDNQGPKISVIVPVYNVEQYLPRCIDSILAQTFTDFELLLIDDGSKDKSGAICDAYARKDPRIRVFHKPNGGVSSARNMGLDNAKGEWIAFVDSDDWVNEDFLANFVEIDSGEDLLSQGFCSPNWHNEAEGKIVSSPTRIVTENQIFDYLLDSFKSEQLGYVWCKAFKKDIIRDKHIRFNLDYHLREDLAFVCQYCSYIISISNTEKAAYMYRYTQQNKSFKNQDSMFVCMDIYENMSYWATNKEQKSNLNIAFANYAICSLIESARNENIIKYCRFFLENFAESVRYAEDRIKKVRLFKKFFIAKKEIYLKVVVGIIHYLVNRNNHYHNIIMKQ